MTTTSIIKASFFGLPYIARIENDFEADSSTVIELLNVSEDKKIVINLDSRKDLSANMGNLIVNNGKNFERFLASSVYYCIMDRFDTEEEFKKYESENVERAKKLVQKEAKKAFKEIEEVIQKSLTEVKILKNKLVTKQSFKTWRLK